MTRIELEYRQNYPEEVNVFLLRVPEIEQHLIEKHADLAALFGDTVSLRLSFIHYGADFTNDQSGEQLVVTIEHDLTQAQGNELLAHAGMRAFGGLVHYNAMSRTTPRNKAATPTHAADACSSVAKSGAPCPRWGGLTIKGVRYCDAHALRPAMEQIMALHTRIEELQRTLPAIAWQEGAEWVIEKLERDLDFPGDFVRELHRDMKLDNKYRISPSPTPQRG